jgi:hypothetical protein
MSTSDEEKKIIVYGDVVNGDKIVNEFKDSEQSIGIIKNIVEYIFDKSTVLNDEGIKKKSTNKLTKIAEKIRLNCNNSAEINAMKRTITNLWRHKEIVEQFFQQGDQMNIIALKDLVQTKYDDNVKKGIVVEDNINKISIDLLNPKYIKDERYTAGSKAIVLYFFELCDIGITNETKNTLFD